MIFGAFTAPTALPTPVSVNRNLFDVKTFKESAVEIAYTNAENQNTFIAGINEVLGSVIDTNANGGQLIADLNKYINQYTVTAMNGSEKVTSADFIVEAKNVQLKTNKNNVVYDGTDHRSEYKLTTTDVLEEDLDAVNADLAKVSISLADDKAQVIDAGDYSFIADAAKVEEILGTNYKLLGVVENKVTVETTVVPLNLNGFATASADKTVLVTKGGNDYKKPAIKVSTQNGSELVKGDDFYLAGTISANKGGNYTTKIQGKNNYTGTLKLDWSVIDGVSFKKAIALSWMSTTGVINRSGNPAVKFTFNRKEVPEFSEGFEVTALGYVYANQKNNNQLVAADLTVDNKGKEKKGNTIKVYNAKTPSFSGNYSLSIADKGFGVTARAFVTLKNVATNTEWTVYTDDYAADIMRTDYASAVNAQMTNAFAIAEVQTPPVAYTESGKNKLQAKFTITKDANASENLKVVEAGYIYSNVAAPSEAADITKWQNMTLEAANDTANTFIKKTSKTTANMSSYTVKFVDNGAGVRYRAFIVVENEDGAKFTKYFDYTDAVGVATPVYTEANTATYTVDSKDIKVAKYNFAAVAQAQLNSLVEVTNSLVDNDAKTNKGEDAAKFSTTRKLKANVSASDVTISEYGFIYVNTLADKPALLDMTEGKAKEDANDAYKIKTATGSAISSEGNTYTLTIKKNGANKVYVRGFVKVKDNKTGIEQYIYADIITGNE